MENDNNNSSNNNKKNAKTEKILKGASYVGAFGAGALGTMAFTTPSHNDTASDTEAATNGKDDFVIETTPDASTTQSTNDDTVVATLSDEQVDELKAELREEIKQELLNDEEFMGEVKEEILARIDPEPIIPPHDPEIEVLDYGTVTNDDGTTATVATLKVDGTHMAAIDGDDDGEVDVLIVDTNNNQVIDESDYIADVRGQGILMEPLCEAAEQRDAELLAGNGNPIENTDHLDYNNSADTTDFTV